MNSIPLFWELVVHEINRISGLNFYDYACIVANFHSVIGTSKEIDPQIENRGYSPEVIAEMQKKFRAEFRGVKSLNLHFTVPLSNFQYDLFNYILFLFRNYEQGILPFPGSASEQPNQIIEIFNVIKALKAEREEVQKKQSESNVGHKDNYKR